jgi:hypothetical protein
MKRIIIKVSPEGETTIETKGYTGSACKNASLKMEEALGLKTRETLTSEYHQRGTSGNTTNQNA